MFKNLTKSAIFAAVLGAVVSSVSSPAQAQRYVSIAPTNFGHVPFCRTVTHVTHVQGGHLAQVQDRQCVSGNGGSPYLENRQILSYIQPPQPQPAPRIVQHRPRPYVQPRQSAPVVAGRNCTLNAGTLLGAAIGGLAGSQVGGGSGKLAATAGGTLLGAIIGSRSGGC